MTTAASHVDPRSFPFTAEVRTAVGTRTRPRVVVLEQFGGRFKIYTLSAFSLAAKPRPLYLRQGMTHLAHPKEIDLETAVPCTEVPQ